MFNEGEFNTTYAHTSKRRIATMTTTINNNNTMKNLDYSVDINNIKTLCIDVKVEIYEERNMIFIVLQCVTSNIQ